MSHSPAHGCVLHGRTSRNLPRQPLPPCEGRGSEQSRFLICLPPPHCRVQVSQDFHLDHAPSTSKAIKSKVRGCSLAGVLWLEIEWNGVHHQGISRFFFFFTFYQLELEMSYAFCTPVWQLAFYDRYYKVTPCPILRRNISSFVKHSDIRKIQKNASNIKSRGRSSVHFWI